MKTKRLHIRIDAGELAGMKRRAKKEGFTLSDWVRWVLKREMKK